MNTNDIQNKITKIIEMNKSNKNQLMTARDIYKKASKIPELKANFDTITSLNKFLYSLVNLNVLRTVKEQDSVLWDIASNENISEEKILLNNNNNSTNEKIIQSTSNLSVNNKDKGFDIQESYFEDIINTSKIDLYKENFLNLPIYTKSGKNFSLNQLEVNSRYFVNFRNTTPTTPPGFSLSDIRFIFCEVMNGDEPVFELKFRKEVISVKKILLNDLNNLKDFVIMNSNSIYKEMFRNSSKFLKIPSFCDNVTKLILTLNTNFDQFYEKNTQLKIIKTLENYTESNYILPPVIETFNLISLEKLREDQHFIKFTHKLFSFDPRTEEEKTEFTIFDFGGDVFFSKEEISSKNFFDISNLSIFSSRLPIKDIVLKLFSASTFSVIKKPFMENAKMVHFLTNSTELTLNLNDITQLNFVENSESIYGLLRSGFINIINGKLVKSYDKKIETSQLIYFSLLDLKYKEFLSSFLIQEQITLNALYLTNNNDDASNIINEVISSISSCQTSEKGKIQIDSKKYVFDKTKIIHKLKILSGGFTNYIYMIHSKLTDVNIINKESEVIFLGYY